MSKLKQPSPAMVVALIALVLAMTGSAAAVVSFARNAGAVDGKSATSASGTNAHVAGKLIATVRSGSSRGTIPAKYLDPGLLGPGRATSFGRASDVIDNANEVAFDIVNVPGVVQVTGTCSDQNKAAGVEDPQTTISVINTSGDAINVARSTANGGALAVGAVVNNAVSSFTLTGSNLYTINVHKGGTNVVIDGVVRQDGKGTSAASCVNYGQALRVG